MLPVQDHDHAYCRLVEALRRERTSFSENGKLQFVESGLLGNHVDRGNLPLRNREAKHPE